MLGTHSYNDNKQLQTQKQKNYLNKNLKNLFDLLLILIIYYQIKCVDMSNYIFRIIRELGLKIVLEKINNQKQCIGIFFTYEFHKPMLLNEFLKHKIL